MRHRGGAVAAMRLGRPLHDRKLGGSFGRIGQETGSEPNVSESLRDIGQEPQSVLALANAADAASALTEETNVARKLGIFGSPTFVVGHELFWGDDRLDDAIGWHREGRLKSSAHDSLAATSRDIPEPDSLGG